METLHILQAQSVRPCQELLRHQRRRMPFVNPTIGRSGYLEQELTTERARCEGTVRWLRRHHVFTIQ